MIPSGSLELAAFVLDADVAVVAGVEDDLHHLEVVGLRLVALGVEVVALGADALGERHQLRHALVAVVLLAGRDAEVAEVRQRAAVGQVRPSSSRRPATAPLDDSPPWFSTITLRPCLAPYSVSRRRPSAASFDLLVVAARC